MICSGLGRLNGLLMVYMSVGDTKAPDSILTSRPLSSINTPNP